MTNYMQYVTTKRNKSIDEMRKERRMNGPRVISYEHRDKNGLLRYEKHIISIGKTIEMIYDRNGRLIAKNVTYPDGGYVNTLHWYSATGEEIFSAEKAAEYAESTAHLELRPWWKAKLRKDGELRIDVEFTECPTESKAKWWYDATTDADDKETKKFPGLRLDNLILETKTNTYGWDGSLNAGNASFYEGDNRFRKWAKLAERDFLQVYKELQNAINNAKEAE